jgi:hypothetical protein
MPSFCDVARDGWLYTFTLKEQLEIPSAHSWAAPVRSTGTVRKRQAVRPVHRVESHTCCMGHSPPASQVGRRVGPAI